MKTEILLAGGIYLLDKKIRECVNSSCLQGTRTKLFGGRVILQNCHNEGAILGVEEIGRENCLEVSAAALGAAAAEYLRQSLHREKKAGRIGLALILGGGLGNHMERRRDGFVTDYLGFSVKNERLRQMAFNLSDFAILGGALLCVTAALLPDRK